MTTVVDFRTRRREADAARSPVSAPPCLPQAGEDAPPSAEIILLPLSWIAHIRHTAPRKPLKRRFAVRPPVLV